MIARISLYIILLYMDHGSCRGGAVAANVCHLQCEISSVTVTALSCPGGGGNGGALFLRCHVPAGGGRMIQIDSHGADVDGGVGGGARSIDASWRDVASLRCDGSPACVRELVDRRSVVFEVRRRRRRRRAMILRPAVGSSELVGRAEVAWRDVVVVAAAASADGADDAAVVERRLELAAAGAAAPAVMSVRMSVRVSETTAAAVPSAGRSAHPAPRRESVNAGCEWSAGGEDDAFAVAACGVADDAFE
ncbi:hypothetical protein E2562_022883 [Oryza meyeriana var. granulata]|uniref:Uncharacterized protein n=1 Tax=Oryza meyeriana var. granulata TaxID=110450 RepID=A0A6G1D8D6_9ORYZ|nr:hypothetical protein E2562_022883 [Oryza meyeriana var. granulata]